MIYRHRVLSAARAQHVSDGGQHPRERHARARLTEGGQPFESIGDRAPVGSR